MHQTRPIDRREYRALLLVLLLALGLRLFRADASLWYDEILTLVNFVRLPTLKLIGTLDSLNNHMLYSLMAQLSVGALGETALALRLPAIVMGVASIWMQWLIARRLMGARGALIVALLMTFSYHHVWFSQNARGYTGLLFFCSAATFAFIRGLERPDWRNWTAYALLVAAAMYVHMSAGFFFAAHGAVYAMLLAARLTGGAWKGRAIAQWPALSGLWPIFGIGLSIVVTLVLYAPIIGQAFATVQEVSQASAAAGGAALAEWLNPTRAVVEIGRSISSAGPLVPVILFAALLVLSAGAYALFRKSPLLVAIYVVHVPLAMLLLSLVGVRIWPRYFFVDIGFIFMAMVEGVVVWSAWISRFLRKGDKPLIDAPALSLVGFIAMLLVSIGLLVPNYLHPKQDFIGARNSARSLARPGDSIAAVGLAGYAYSHYYAQDFKVIDTAAELEALRAATPGRTWVILAFPHQTLVSRPDVKAELDAHFASVRTFKGTLGDGQVWLQASKDDSGR